MSIVDTFHAFQEKTFHHSGRSSIEIYEQQSRTFHMISQGRLLYTYVYASSLGNDHLILRVGIGRFPLIKIFICTMLTVKIFIYHIHRIKLFIFMYVKPYCSNQNDLKSSKYFSPIFKIILFIFKKDFNQKFYFIILPSPHFKIQWSSP